MKDAKQMTDDYSKRMAALNFEKAKMIVKEKLGIEPTPEIIEELKRIFDNPYIK